MLFWRILWPYLVDSVTLMFHFLPVFMIVAFPPLISDKDTNKVQTTIIVSKEYVPIWTITREILHDMLEDVMSRIAKKKAPTKKTKADVIRKPTRKAVKPGEVSEFAFQFSSLYFTSIITISICSLAVIATVRN